MAQRITRFSVGQTAKVFGVLYALIGLCLAPFFLVFGMMAPEGQGLGTVFAIAMPVLYGAMGLVGAAIGCALYNLVAGWVGGIEVELDQSGA